MANTKYLPVPVATSRAITNQVLADNPQLKSAIQPQIGMDSVSNTVNNAKSSVEGMVNDALAALSNLGANPLGVLGSSLGDLTATVTNAVSTAFGTVNETIGALTSNLGAIANGPKEVLSQIESLAADSAEALSSPVSFITRATNDVLQGTGMEQVLGKTQDWLKDMDGDLLGKIGSATGLGNILSTDGLKNAISKATNELAKGFGGVDGLFGDVKSVLNNAGDYLGSFATGIADTIDSVAGSILPTGILKGVHNITDDIRDLVPDKMGDWLASKSEKFLDKAISKATDTVSKNIAHAISKVTGVGISDTILTDIMKGLYSNGNRGMNGAVMSDGTTLYPKAGNNSTQVIDKLYEAARGICSNVQPLGYIDYDRNKDTFDLLATLAAKLGLTDLLEQLRQCANANNLYFDSRTIQSLASTIRDIAMDGNPFSFGTVVETAGVSNVSDPATEYKILGANLPNDSGYRDEYYSVGNRIGICTDDVLRSSASTAKNSVISGRDAIFMGAGNNGVVEQALRGKENKILLDTSMSLYGSYMRSTSNSNSVYRAGTSISANQNRISVSTRSNGSSVVVINQEPTYNSGRTSQYSYSSMQQAFTW